MFTLPLRLRPVPLGLGLGVSCSLAASSFSRHKVLSPLTFSSYALRCDSSPSSPFNRYQRDAQAPVVSSGGINPRAVRQFSLGSIAGLFCGLAVSVFSKPLAVILGLLVCGVQALESRGLHIIPYSRLQSYFTNTDMTSALQDNIALKLSFGLAFALSAFAEF